MSNCKYCWDESDQMLYPCKCVDPICLVCFCMHATRNRSAYKNKFGMMYCEICLEDYQIDYNLLDFETKYNWFLNGFLTDTVLRIIDDNKTMDMNVHKDILQQSSSYFSKLFEKNAKYYEIDVPNAKFCYNIILEFYGIKQDLSRLEWKKHLLCLKCYYLLHIKIENEHVKDLMVPADGFKKLLKLVNLIGYTYDIISLVIKNLPKDYQIENLDVRILKVLTMGHHINNIHNENILAIIDSRILSRIFEVLVNVSNSCFISFEVTDEFNEMFIVSMNKKTNIITKTKISQDLFKYIRIGKQKLVFKVDPFYFYKLDFIDENNIVIFELDSEDILHVIPVRDGCKQGIFGIFYSSIPKDDFSTCNANMVIVPSKLFVDKCRMFQKINKLVSITVQKNFVVVKNKKYVFEYPNSCAQNYIGWNGFCKYNLNSILKFENCISASAFLGICSINENCLGLEIKVGPCNMNIFIVASPNC